MWELDYKDSWVPKNWCFWTGAGEDSWDSDCKEIQTVNTKGTQSWYSLEGLLLKLKLPILWPPDKRTDYFEKTLMLGKIEGWRRRKIAGGEEMTEDKDGWMASLTRWTWVWASSGSWWWTGKPGVLQSMGSQRIRHTWASEMNWTELNYGLINQMNGPILEQIWEILYLD